MQTSRSRMATIIISLWLVASSPASFIYYQYFEGNWNSLPVFDWLPVIRGGAGIQFDLDVQPRDDHFGVRYIGRVQVDTPGMYTFYVTSDDGAQLRINDQLVVDNDGIHSPVEKAGTISLTAGLHAIEVLYFEYVGGSTLLVEWSGPGIARQVINPVKLFLPEEIIAANDLAIGGFETPLNIAVRANDFVPQSRTASVTDATDGSNGVTTINGDGTITYTPNPGFVGSDQFLYTLTDDLGQAKLAAVFVRIDRVQARFELVSSEIGLGALPGGSGEFHVGGVTFTDLTRDHYPDLYIISGSVFVGGARNSLFVNVPDDDGGRTFERVNKDGGADATSPATTGAIAADFDNDGDLDLYVTNYRADNVLYRSMWMEDHPSGTGDPRNLRFVDVTASTDPTPANPIGDVQHGVAYAAFQNPNPFFGNDRLDGTVAAAWADVNRDGFADLYVASFDGTSGDPFSARDNQLGERDTLYLNNGDGTFIDVTMTPPWPASGWEPVGGFAFADGSFNDQNFPSEFASLNALQFADFNNDNWPDLVVATMGGGNGGPNRDALYINQGQDSEGNWRGFRLVSWELGFGGNDSSDMGATVADIDNDGDLDYFTTNGSTNSTMWINQLSETGTLGFAFTTIQNVFAWGCNFHDFDNNGRFDLLVATLSNRRNYFHLQNWNGTFIEKAQSANIAAVNMGRSVTVADYNQDGWSDPFVFNLSTAWNGGDFFENQSATLNPDMHFLTLRLVGDPTLACPLRSTADALGARAYITADFNGSGVISASETVMDEVVSGHSNGPATSSLDLEFGLGLATVADVRIRWPSGRETFLSDVAADQFLTIVEMADDTDLDDVPDDCDACPATVPGVVTDAVGCPPFIAGDFDQDGDIGMDDYVAMENCLAGPGVPLAGECTDRDLNGDSSTDLHDIGHMQRCFGGDDVPADPNCG